MSAFRRCCLLLAPLLVACNALLGTESGDSADPPSEPAGDDDDAATATEGEADSNPDSSDPLPRESPDGGVCGLPPDCLDPTDEDVIEVPTEGTLSAVLTKVKASQTIQAIPGATSFVVDGVNTASASDPGADFRGCPRPRPGRTKQALADIGALER